MKQNEAKPMADPFGGLKPQDSPKLELQAPDVSQFVKQHQEEQKVEDDNAMYCSLCGMRAEACQHLRGKHHGNTYDAVRGRANAERRIGLSPEMIQHNRTEEKNIRRNCGCF